MARTYRRFKLTKDHKVVRIFNNWSDWAIGTEWEDFYAKEYERDIRDFKRDRKTNYNIKWTERKARRARTREFIASVMRDIEVAEEMNLPKKNFSEVWKYI